ncbi:MAG: H-NS histone family protein [Pseudomonadota bacterium]
MSIDLSKLTLVELKKLAASVEKAIATAEGKRLREARQAVEKISKEYGVPVTELLARGETPTPKKAPKKKKAKAVPQAKFRNPADPTKTWTGKGRRPGWYVEALENGVSEEDLLVSGASS